MLLPFRSFLRLLKEQRLHLRLRFPYPTAAWADVGNNFTNDDKHVSKVILQKNNAALFQHTIDTTIYYVAANGRKTAIKKKVRIIITSCLKRQTVLR